MSNLASKKKGGQVPKWQFRWICKRVCRFLGVVAACTFVWWIGSDLSPLRVASTHGRQNALPSFRSEGGRHRRSSQAAVEPVKQAVYPRSFHTSRYTSFRGARLEGWKRTVGTVHLFRLRHSAYRGGGEGRFGHCVNSLLADVPADYCTCSVSDTGTSVTSQATRASFSRASLRRLGSVSQSASVISHQSHCLPSISR